MFQVEIYRINSVAYTVLLYEFLKKDFAVKLKS
jgi:hypothetical protein